MNGWSDVKLSDIQLEKSGFAPLPEGDFTFQLVPGAQYRERNGFTELNLSASIAEGELAGRRVFFSYPDPSSTNAEGKPKTWSKQALKKLQVVLGEEPLEGEDAVEYFNRISSSGVARFGAKLQKGNYIPQGQTEPRVELGLFSVKPAA